MNETLTTASATDLAQRIRDGKLSSREAVEAHIARIEFINPTINAVVAERFEDARREADAADARIARDGTDDLPPFFGVPCSIKECFALEGMPNTSGHPGRLHVRAESDAIAVGRLRDAGAIPLGVTNVSELCMWMETNNKVYGRTRNPYNPAHIVGGSSGGEGAIVAAGGAPFGLGSDVAGSIRFPAFFNGVFGHKPSAGLVPNTGQYPLAEDEVLGYLSTGPIARRARDLYPILKNLAGPSEHDEYAYAQPLLDPTEVDLRGLRVLNVRDDGFTPVSRELRDAQQNVADHLARQGAKVEDRRFPRLKRGFEIWSAMLSPEGTTDFATLMGNGEPFRALPELAKLVTRRSQHTMPAVLLAVGEQLTHGMKGHARKMRKEALALRAELEEALGDDGVMLYPSYPKVAPRHDVPLATPHYFVYCGLINIMHLPSTQVPLGLNRKGLPLGVQVIGAHGKDHLTLAVGEHLEDAFGGWVPPFK